MTATSTEIEPILEKYSHAGREALIPLLQDVQEMSGYLSRDAVVRIGRHLGLPTSKVYGVATFYNQFRFCPQGRFHIQVCRGTACHVKGSAKVLEAIERCLKIRAGETTRNGLFSLEVVSCVGACGLAPVISVSDEIFAGVKPEAVKEIIDSFRKKASEDDSTDE